MIVAVTLNPAIDRTALVDEVRLDTVLRPLELVVLPGGKGNNVARAARALGAEATTLGIAGGASGRALVDGLRRERLSPRYVTVTGETRTTYTVVDRTGRAFTVYEQGEALAAATLDRVIQGLAALSSHASYVVLAGSLPVGLPGDAYAQLVEACRRAGRPCLVDTSGAALSAALPAGPTVAKVNLEEAAGALGLAYGLGSDAGLRAAESLVAAGAATAVVTLGADGAVCASEEAAWAVDAPTSGPYAVGAGDAFTAGLVTVLEAGGSLDEALRRAAAAGSASTLRLGAGVVDRVDVDRCRAAVRRVA